MYFQQFERNGAKVRPEDGFEMVKNMAANVETMMQHKIDAIKVGVIISVGAWSTRAIVLLSF